MANIDKLITKGLHHWKSNELLEAQKIFKKLILIRPSLYEIKSYLGIIEIKLGNFDIGIGLLESANKIAPYDKNIKNNLSNALIDYAIFLIDKSNFQKAGVVLKNSINFCPSNLNAYLNFLKLASETKNYQEADEIFKRAKEIDDLNPDLFYVYANLLFDQKKYKLALEFFQKALNLKSDFYQCLFHEALCYGFLGDDKLALEKFDEAIKINPNYYLAIHNKALFFLSKNNFQEGWKLHRFRWMKEKSKLDFLVTEKPELSSAPKKDETIFLWAEQGIGDQILFLSMLNDFLKYTKNIIVSIDERLISIFQRSFEGIHFVKKNIHPSSLNFDKHLPIGNIGCFVRNNILDFKDQKKAFLIPNNEIKQQVEKKYKSNKKMLCGLSWSSVKTDYADSKSIKLQDLEKLMTQMNFDFINLQYVDSHIEINNLRGNSSITFYETDEIDKFNDLDAFASLIAACDCIITISNVTAHFAGALGVRTFLLAPYGYGRIWYWSDEGISKWYPSVHVIHQKEPDTWAGAINELAKKF